jgi:hypothetical protein
MNDIDPKPKHVPTDRNYLLTRITHGVFAAIVLPFFIGLYFYPENTERNFAWPLTPRMSAMLFGSFYLSVVFNYSIVALSKKWHEIAIIVWTTIPTLTCLGIVTVLHWDKFHHNTLPFYVWFVVYLILPSYLLVMLLFNRREETHTIEANEAIVPVWLRAVSAVLSLLSIFMAFQMLFYPTKMIADWPWALKPLGARAIGCLFLAPAVAHCFAAVDKRWSSVRLAAQSSFIWFGSLFFAVYRSWDEFDTTRNSTWVFITVLVVEILLAVVAYVLMERTKAKMNVAGN